MTPYDREEEQDILFGVINRFIGYFTRQAVPATINDTTKEYPFVAMDTRQAYEQILLARSFLQKKHPGSEFRFIDIGCGIGNIMLLAEMAGFSIFGIEKDTPSFETARSLVGAEYVSQEDIWNFNKLGDYDLIYYFRPFCEKITQLRFERHIEDQIKPGSVLIANRKMDDTIDSDKRFKRLSAELPVWYKIC